MAKPYIKWPKARKFVKCFPENFAEIYSKDRRRPRKVLTKVQKTSNLPEFSVRFTREDYSNIYPGQNELQGLNLEMTVRVCSAFKEKKVTPRPANESGMTEAAALN